MGRANPELKDAILAHLRKHHPGICRGWFNDLEIVEVTGGILKILVCEPVQLRYLQHSCVEHFTEAARACTGHLLVVRFVGEGEEHEQTNGFSAGSNIGDAECPIAPYDEMLLSPDFSFANFVIGPGNQLAHAGALAVAQQPGRAYNPFFIHGGVGLGKTHLLHAICQEAMRRDASTHILYLSCNAFMACFVNAVQQGQMNEFRHRFRNIDLLVIDDIHDLSTRDRTQEEFFHTFNSLYQSGRQIVLSSDAPPNEIPHLEDRLTSRFNSGLVAAIEQPCYETRVAIVHSKATLRGITLPDDVACLIASQIDTNIRELEGTITKLQGLASLRNAAIDLEVAREALNVPSAGPRAASQPTIQGIIDSVTSYYNVKLADLLSKRRHKSIALPRQVAMWLARQHTRHSLEEIGAYLGGRDHTTVLHAIRSIESRRTTEPMLERDLAHFNHALGHIDAHVSRTAEGGSTESATAPARPAVSG